ncbi:MAG: hypothetical protein MUE36_02920 [Acidimicrobiales bacterium]|nr:hypothetical protein [Acidimicrobiales bacterium]
MRVALVTTSDARVLVDDVDRPLLDEAFARAGVDVVRAAWDDPDVAWAAFDLVVVRSPWDYCERIADFGAWLGVVDGLPTVHNPPGLIRWNLDKRYLVDLAGRGVPVVPTTFVDDDAELPAAIAAAGEGNGEVVLKPSVSAGSRLTGRFPVGSAAAVALGRDILGRGLVVMVQPYARSVGRAGERSAVLFDGTVSHTFRKGPILADDGALHGGAYREEITVTSLSPHEAAVVEQASAVVGSIAVERGWLAPGGELLYERFDLVRTDDGSDVLLEAELFEPSFFLPVDPPAADRFVAAVVARARSR